MKMTWKKDQPDYTTIAWAILAGAGAGLAVGLLLAPKSGEELRSDIGSTVDDYMESARQKAGDLRTSATDMANRGMSEVRKAAETVADKVHDVVDHGEKESLRAINDATAAADRGAKKTKEATQDAAAAARAGARA